ncbi:unnamed protein product, partial [Symbiodinium pilosum]
IWSDEPEDLLLRDPDKDKYQFDRNRFARAVRCAEESRAALVGNWRELGWKKRKKEIEQIVYLDEDEGKKVFVLKFQRWLEQRQLGDCLQRDQGRDPPSSDGKPPRAFLYYRYTPPCFPENAQMRPDGHWATAYHGTWFYGLRSILHHGVLLESTDESAGHEFWLSGLYVTQNLYTANWYARAQNVFNDGVFHRAIMEVKYDPAKRKKYRERGGGQIVVSSDGVAITGVIIQPNSPPNKGEERSEEWNDRLEIIPGRNLEEHQEQKDPPRDASRSR